MNCPVCGNELREGAKFCVECGTPITEDTPQPVTAEETPVQEAEPINQENTETIEAESHEEQPEDKAETAEEQPAEIEPAPQTEPEKDAEPVQEKVQQTTVLSYVTDPRMLLTTAQYFFLTILFHIPVIGLIFMFVWALGRPKNLSLKRFSLAMLLLRLIGMLLVLASTIFALLGVNGLIPGIVLPSISLPFVH